MGPSSTEWSYERPLDRPSKLYCRVCSKLFKYTLLASGRDCPRVCSAIRCHYCSSTGSIVWVWGTFIEDRKVWKPACGDPACIGLCDNPACIPPAPAVAEKEKRSRRFDAVSFLAGAGIAGLVELIQYFWLR